MTGGPLHRVLKTPLKVINRNTWMLHHVFKIYKTGLCAFLCVFDPRDILCISTNKKQVGFFFFQKKALPQNIFETSRSFLFKNSLGFPVIVKIGSHIMCVTCGFLELVLCWDFIFEDVLSSKFALIRCFQLLKLIWHKRLAIQVTQPNKKIKSKVL